MKHHNSSAPSKSIKIHSSINSRTINHEKGSPKKYEKAVENKMNKKKIKIMNQIEHKKCSFSIMKF